MAPHYLYLEDLEEEFAKMKKEALSKKEVMTAQGGASKPDPYANIMALSTIPPNLFNTLGRLFKKERPRIRKAGIEERTYSAALDLLFFNMQMLILYLLHFR